MRGHGRGPCPLYTTRDMSTSEDVKDNDTTSKLSKESTLTAISPHQASHSAKEVCHCLYWAFHTFCILIHGHKSLGAINRSKFLTSGLGGYLLWRGCTIVIEQYILPPLKHRWKTSLAITQNHDK